MERRRCVPLVLLGMPERHRADALARAVRCADPDAVVHVARSFAGCLRVATSVGPYVIVLDRGAPDSLERLLAAHPVSSRARIARLTDKSETDADVLRTVLARLSASETAAAAAFPGAA